MPRPSVPLLINAHQPYKGPLVPLVRRYGHLVVEGLRDGNRVVLIACSTDLKTEAILLEVQSNGDHPFVMPSLAFVRGAYLGDPNPELTVFLQ